MENEHHAMSCSMMCLSEFGIFDIVCQVWHVCFLLEKHLISSSVAVGRSSNIQYFLLSGHFKLDPG